jgi:hypothetical protein
MKTGLTNKLVIITIMTSAIMSIANGSSLDEWDLPKRVQGTPPTSNHLPRLIVQNPTSGSQQLPQVTPPPQKTPRLLRKDILREAPATTRADHDPEQLSTIPQGKVHPRPPGRRAVACPPLARAGERVIQELTPCPRAAPLQQLTPRTKKPLSFTVVHGSLNDGDASD